MESYFPATVLSEFYSSGLLIMSGFEIPAIRRETAHLAISAAISLVCIIAFIYATVSFPSLLSRLIPFQPACTSFRIHSIYAATFICIWIFTCFVGNMIVATYYVEAEEMNCEQTIWFWLMVAFIFTISSAIVLFLYHQGMEAVEIERKNNPDAR